MSVFFSNFVFVHHYEAKLCIFCLVLLFFFIVPTGSLWHVPIKCTVSPRKNEETFFLENVSNFFDILNEWNCFATCYGNLLTNLNASPWNFWSKSIFCCWYKYNNLMSFFVDNNLANSLAWKRKKWNVLGWSSQVLSLIDSCIGLIHLWLKLEVWSTHMVDT